MSLGEDQNYFDEEEENTARNDVENRQIKSGNPQKPSGASSRKVQSISGINKYALFA